MEKIELKDPIIGEKLLQDALNRLLKNKQNNFKFMFKLKFKVRIYLFKLVKKERKINLVKKIQIEIYLF